MISDKKQIYQKMSKLYAVRHAKEVKVLSKMLHLRTKYEQQKEKYKKSKEQVKDIENQMVDLTRSSVIVGNCLNIEYINNTNRKRYWLNYDHEKFSYYLEKEKGELSEAYNEYTESKNAYKQCKVRNEEIDKKLRTLHREICNKIEQIHDDELVDSNYSKRIGV